MGKMSFWLRADIDYDALRPSYENLEDKSEYPTYESYMAAFPASFAADGCLYTDVQLTVCDSRIDVSG